MTLHLETGDVYWANLRPRSAAEQTGKRPVIILSHDAFNQTRGWRSIIVIRCSTSKRQRRRGPTAIALPKGRGGLRESGVALCHQITTLDRDKLAEKIGALSPALLQAVEAGILAALDIDCA